MEYATAERDLDLQELSSLSAALTGVQPLIKFDLQGIVLHANDNFLKTLGYKLENIRGQHHRMFCEPSYTAVSVAYRQFWERLGRGYPCA